MAFEQLFFELVKNGIRRTVEVRIELIQNHIALLLDLVDREGRIEGNVGNQLHRPLEVLLGKGGVYPRVFFRRVGVEFTPHRIQAVQDVKGFSFAGTFE